MTPRFGLALSGGGFRASFFHIGVLARLAELDLLRHVEVISTVSGGSILGAFYYLHLKRLLESKEDREITRDDYVGIVADIERGFLEGVQTNIRMRTFATLSANVRMALKESYSRSDRLGELYDSVFYAPVLGGRSVTMTDLLVAPRGHEGPFRPSTGNPGRAAKVPVLYLNATTLNTGRHWLFTPTGMGETASTAPGRGEEADVNAVIHWLRYEEAAEPRHRVFPLGIAVAASACVPGLFPPLPVIDLVDGWSLQLVDGGVHDNQGLAVLDERRCQAVMVSDGSGQLDDQRQPSPFIASVLGRTNELLMDRIRDLTIGGTLRRGDRRPAAVVHLKEDLVREEVTARGRPPRPPRDTASTTRYGVSRTVQDLLAHVRTDLDAFSDLEADALMASGYLMTRDELRPEAALVRFLGPQAAEPAAHAWRFGWIVPHLGRPEVLPRLVPHLRVAKEQAFKVVRLAPRLRAALLAIVVFLLGALSVYLWTHRDQPVLPAGSLDHAVHSTTWEMVLSTVATALAALLLGGSRSVRLRVLRVFLWGGAGVGAWLIAKTYLALLNPVFLRKGRRPHPDPPQRTGEGGRILGADPRS